MITSQDNLLQSNLIRDTKKPILSTLLLEHISIARSHFCWGPSSDGLSYWTLSLSGSDIFSSHLHSQHYWSTIHVVQYAGCVNSFFQVVQIAFSRLCMDACTWQRLPSSGKSNRHWL